YDPISQEEYFRVFAIFNQSEDSDKADNSPNLMYLAPEDTKCKEALTEELAELQKQIANQYPNFEETQTKWEKEVDRDGLPAAIKGILGQPAAKRKPPQKEQLADFFLGTLADLKDIQPRLLKVKQELAKIQPVPTPIMRELAEGEKRVTK